MTEAEIKAECEAIEDALDTLLIATIEADARRPRKPLKSITAFDLAEVSIKLSESGPYASDAADIIDDPVGRALRRAVRLLGKRLYAIGGLEAMGDACQRVADRDPDQWQRRTSIMDHGWNMIGTTDPETNNFRGWVSWTHPQPVRAPAPAEEKSMISHEERADRIVRGMGFADTSNGPMVFALRRLIDRKVRDGLVGGSPGTWARDDLTDEQRAQALLAQHWEIDHGHSYRVECFDRPWGWRYDWRADRRTFEVCWRRLPAWLGDRLRATHCDLRVWWDRSVLGLRNPYAGAIFTEPKDPRP